MATTYSADLLATHGLATHLASEAALDAFLAAFHNRTLPKSEWTHAAHIALAANSVYGSDVPTALPQVRQTIRAYNEAIGGQNTATSGYHETLTVFWLRVVAARLQELRLAANPTRIEAARTLVAEFGDNRNLHNRYYSTNIVLDPQARRHWIAPDRATL